MKNVYGSARVRHSFFVVFVFILVATFFLSGCETMRRKFTRKKKVDETKNMEVPVLEPMEYPAKVYGPEELYANHYSLWKVWYREFSSSLEGNSSNRKRQLFLLNKAIVELEEMKGLLNEQANAGLVLQLEMLKSIERDLSAPVSSRDWTSIKLDAQRADKIIRKSFSPALAKENLKP